jgi:hypothetical protein
MTYQKQWNAGDFVEAADLNGNFTPLYMFGGNGTDGALSIAAGTTTINVGAVQIFIKNYSSISITGTGVLNFSNPHANGTIIRLYFRKIPTD